MKKTGLLNRDLTAIVGAMGHYDRLVVCDAGFPIPLDHRYVDLALRPDQPRVLDVVELLLTELEVEQIRFASEALDKTPDRLEQLSKLAPLAEVSHIPHTEFKELAQGSRAIVRTGDFTPYANVMLISGVVY
jgi:D-ribose pyranase